jgi:IMP dehydrogenase
VMLGSLLASADETPGEVVELEGARWKEVAGLRLDDLELPRTTGLPRVDAYLARHGAPRVEGGDARIPATGPCHLTLLTLARGVRMGVHLAGGTDLASLRARARFARVSPAGAAEAFVAAARRG